MTPPAKQKGLAMNDLMSKTFQAGYLKAMSQKSIGDMLIKEENATPLLKINKAPGGKGQPNSISWIEMRLANGEVRWGKVEVYSPFKVVVTECNNLDTTDLIRIH